MTCDHAGCDAPATVACRFGDGTYTHSGLTRRQTFVRYCDHDFQTVAAMFRLCHIQPVPTADFVHNRG